MAGKENTLQEFGKYVSQSVLSQLGVSCYILADTYFISKGVGADGLTALNLAIPVFSVMNGCGFMLGIGSGTKYGIMKGTGNEKRGDVLFTSSLCVVTVLAVIFMLIGLLAADPITALVGANAEVYDMTRTYLQVILLFSPMFMINNLLGAMIRNDGNTSLAMTAMLSGCLFNIVFDYIFVTVILAMLIYVGIYWNADVIAMIFNSGRDMDLQRIAVEGLKIYFTACPFVGANILLAIYFAATDQAAPAQMISLLRGLIVIIPLAFIMANVAGLTGVWMTFPLTELVVCVVACGLYKKMKRTYLK